MLSQKHFMFLSGLFHNVFVRILIPQLFMHFKRFLEWIGLKEKLDAKQSKVPHVSEGQIWWACLGENVGFEINGKSSVFARPVIIYKKLTRGFYFVIPVTSQEKIGTWYVPFKLKDKQSVACLHQARSIDYRRLLNQMGWLKEDDFLIVQCGFLALYRIKIIPIISDGVAGKP